MGEGVEMERILNEAKQGEEVEVKRDGGGALPQEMGGEKEKRIILSNGEGKGERERERENENSLTAQGSSTEMP